MATSTQPQAHAGMTVGGNRNAKNLPLVDGHREWSHGLFDCLEDPATCLFSWFLPCVIYGKNKTRLQSLETQGVSHPEGGELLGSDTITYGALNMCCGLGWILGMGLRADIRSRYQISGDTGSDCFLSCCCAPCSLTQQSRELELEEQSLGHQGGGMGYLMGKKA